MCFIIILLLDIAVVCNTLGIVEQVDIQNFIGYKDKIRKAIIIIIIIITYLSIVKNICLQSVCINLPVKFTICLCLWNFIDFVYIYLGSIKDLQDFPSPTRDQVC